MRGPRKRRLLSSLLVLAAAVTAAALWAVAGTGSNSVTAQTAPRSSMGDRLSQLMKSLSSPERNTVQAALDEAMEVLYGGMRTLPSPGVPGTQTADEMIATSEIRLANTLFNVTQAGPADARAQALDLKFMIEQINEVAQAVAPTTSTCGDGMQLDQPPCNQLLPLIDLETGHEMPAVRPPTGVIVRPGFSVELRGPAVPPWFKGWQHDIRTTEPLSPDQCSAVFKETRGLILRLVFDRIIIVTDPWVATVGAPRGTAVPVWRLEWVPAQYVKVWNICNVAGALRTTVSQHIKRDIALNWFWRFYPKDP